MSWRTLIWGLEKKKKAEEENLENLENLEVQLEDVSWNQSQMEDDSSRVVCLPRAE